MLSFSSPNADMFPSLGNAGYQFYRFGQQADPAAVGRPVHSRACERVVTGATNYSSAATHQNLPLIQITGVDQIDRGARLERGNIGGDNFHQTAPGGQ